MSQQHRPFPYLVCSQKQCASVAAVAVPTTAVRLLVVTVAATAAAIAERYVVGGWHSSGKFVAYRTSRGGGQ
eukprot:12327-Heterococcus_DN1.PRE.4